MTATVVLDASQLELLVDTLEIYEGAQLGQLNATAETLAKVAGQLGYRRALHGPLLPWARETIAVHRP